MKIKKEVQKQYIQCIKEHAEHKGYKIVQNSLFREMADKLAIVDFLIVNSKKLVFRIYIKRNSYDSIFWSIMKMDANITKTDSLRAKGAFAAPAILIKKGEYELSDSVNEFAEMFIQNVDVVLEEFINTYDVNEYIFTHSGMLDDEILKCLAYIDSNQVEKAVDIAKMQVECRNVGRYINEGAGFFELVLTKYMNY